MGKTYKEQVSYDYIHDNKPVSKKDYSKLKKKWNKQNFGIDRSEYSKKKYKDYDFE